VRTIELSNELTRLYEEEGAALWRAVLVYAGTPDVASDAVAEAFAQFARRAHDVRSPRAWLWRAAFKIAAGELQRRSKLDPIEDSPYLMTDTVPILAALAALSPRQRACITLRYHFGYTSGEVATILGIAPSTVRVHVLQARRLLRSLLEVHDDD
jgi:RNA polymerase sigma-70 factor (ECF subfamily)